MPQGSHIFYGGVELRDCETTFKQELCYDETRNATFSKFVIEAKSTVFGFFFSEIGQLPIGQPKLHPSAVSTPNSEVGATAIDRMIIIERLLSAPRKDFWYAMTGTHREDKNEDVYQILLAATGIEPTEGQEYFQDASGNDIEIRYADFFHPNPLDNTGEPLTKQKVLRDKCVDVNNGPITRNVRIEQFFGGKAFRVSVEFEICRVLCKDVAPATGSRPTWMTDEMGIESNPKILSNSWSVEETIDENWRRTKTIEGTLRTRGNRTIADWAQWYRHLVLPGVLPGYRRKSMRFVTDPTNLALKYKIEDQQAEAAPPAPCVSWKMHHTDQDFKEYGMVRRTLTIQLVGPPRANRLTLIGTALNLLDARFPGATLMLDDPEKIKQIRGRDSFIRDAMIVSSSAHEPIVELVCEVTMVNDNGGDAKFGNALEASCSDLSIAGYNPDVWPAPRPYDAKDPVGIFGCYFQQPCSPWHGMPKAMKAATDSIPNAYPVQPDGYSGEYWISSNNIDYAVFESPIEFNEQADVTVVQHHVYPYTHVDIDTEYQTDEGTMVLPLSGMRNITPQVSEGAQPNPVMVGVCAIQLHPPMMHRIIRVNCTRHGRPPELPQPAKFLIDPNGVVEQLVGESQMILNAHKQAQDGANRVFSGQIKLTYVLARQLGSHERFRAANDPSLITAPGHNWIPGAAIFSRNRIEYHEEPLPYSPGGTGIHDVYSPFNPSLSNEVGAGYDEVNVTRPGYPYYEYPGAQPPPT